MNALITKLRKLNVELSLVESRLKINAPQGVLTKDVLEEIKSHKTQLIEYIERATQNNTFVGIPTADSKEYYVLSSAQQRLYALNQFDKNALSYNAFQVIQLTGKLNKNRLKQAFQELIIRHEVLRTSFEQIDGEAVQRIWPTLSLDIKSAKVLEEEVSQSIKEFIRPFDLAKAPLIRVGLLEIEEEKCILMLDMHHIITDGVSRSILIRDFMALYNQETLPELELQYKDYAEWQQSEAQQTEIAKQKSFWLSEFEEPIEPLSLPHDFVRSAIKQYDGKLFHFEICREETKALKELADSQGISLFMLTLSAFGILLGKLARTQDLVIGTTTAGRQRADLQNIMGMFVNTLALRLYPKETESLSEYFSAIKSKVLACLDNQSYQYEQLINELKIERDPSRNPLFDVMFAFQNFEKTQLKMANIDVEQLNIQSNISQFDLSLTALEKNEQLCFYFEYATTLFSETRITWFVDYYKRILSAIAEKGVQTKLSEISLLSPEEASKYIYVNDKSIEASAGASTVWDLIEKQISSHSENTAIQFKEDSWSYSELGQKVNQMASWLMHEKKFKQGDKIALILDREPQYLISILAVLKIGASYIPIDPNYPESRIQDILEDAQPEGLIGKSPWIGENTFLFIDLSEASKEIETYEGRHNFPKLSGKDLAYVIYTSGSTGKPKGVMIEHGSLLNYASWAAETYISNQASVFALFTSVAFDLTLTTIFPPLISGGQIEIYKKESHNLLIDQILEDNVAEVLKLTPTHLRLIRDKVNYTPDESLKLKALVVGGEALPFQLANDIYDLFGGRVQIYNEYGPTEATVGCMIHQFHPEEKGNAVPIGLPIANTQIYVLDSSYKPVPPGVSGDLYIAGKGLARGYLSDQTQTDQRFIENPFVPGTRMYKSGDLVTIDTHGKLVFMGRSDQQLKIRGFRVELSEIESILGAHPKIIEALVLVKKKKEQVFLIAYYESKEAIEPKELKNWIKGKMPEYMAPDFLVHLEAWPLTPNGKLDYKSLPEYRIETGNQNPETYNKIEAKLLEIWEELLQIDAKHISIEESFFNLGGNSITASRLINQIYKEFEVEISLQDIFTYQHIVGLSAEIAKLEKSTYSAIPTLSDQETYVLSSAQERLYFLYEFDRDSIAYNIPQLVEIEGQLDKKALEDAFHNLVIRHESLRTYFEQEESKPVQKIASGLAFQVDYIQAEAAAVKDHLLAYIRPFDLSKAPLIRVCVISTSELHHVMVVDMHHIITDGVSHSLLIQDFMSLYSGEKLSDISITYKDYAAWQQSEEEQVEILSQKSFWLGEFAEEVPVLELPTDYIRPKLKSYEGDSYDFRLNEVVTKKLQAIAEEEGASMFMLMMAMYNILLSKLSNQEDIVVGTWVSGRQHPDTENLVGLFVNTLPIRNYPKSTYSFRNFLKEIKTKTLDCFENQDYPYEELVNQLKVQRDTSRNALFDAGYSYQNFGDTELRIPGLTLKPVKTPTSLSKYDLTLFVFEEGNEIKLNFEYASRLFKKETIERISGYVYKLLDSIIDNPDRKIKEISLFGAKEQLAIKQRLSKNLAKEISLIPIQQTYIESFKKFRENIAVEYGDLQITYEEMEKEVNRITEVIAQHNLPEHSRVGILCKDRYLMICSILAVLKSRAAFVPLDTSLPKGRLAGMISQIEAPLILTDQDSLVCKGLMDTESSASILSLLDLDREAEPAIPLEKEYSLNDEIYTFFTSGSTGTPKGVIGTNKGLGHFVDWEIRTFSVDDSCRISQLIHPGFDAFLRDIFVPLCVGGRICIPENEDLLSGANLSRWIIEKQINLIHCVPSFFKFILEEGVNKNFANHLRYVLLSGEKILPYELRDWYEMFSYQIQLVNLYGPTETTMTKGFHLIRPEESQGSFIPIKSMPGAQIMILNQHRQLCPQGVTGEIYIRTPFRTAGYLDKNGATNASFVQNPFSTDSEDLLYKTGDWGKEWRCGEYEILGRKDEQIKIRGIRVELDEIKEQILKYPGIKDAIVHIKEDPIAGKVICSYLLSARELSIDGLRDHLTSQLPGYMIPSFFIQLEQFPVLPNGKIDKQNLPDPQAEGTESYEGPQNEEETLLQEIWSEVLTLDKDQISVEKSFFEMGGHSLKLLLIINKINKAFGIKISLEQIFRKQTIRQLADYLISLRQLEPQFEKWDETIEIKL